MITRFATAVAIVCLSSGPLQAKVNEKEVARLGEDLTPYGGEVSANEDGSIPQWNGKWQGLPPGLKYDSPTGKRPNPYAEDKTLISITSENYQEHAKRLSEGQVALFERYPQFRMDIYPSHRDFKPSDLLIQKTSWNAAHTEMINESEGIRNYTGGIAFPVPDHPLEVMWNTRTNRGFTTYRGEWYSHAVFANGERSTTGGEYVQSNPFNNPENTIPTTEEAVGDFMFYTVSESLLPPRERGTITVTQEPIDYKKLGRNAWQYNPGTRRVRKAPSIGYDNPTGAGGLQTIDDHEGFNGAFDRYTYKLLGKREMYIPYHNYDFNNPEFGDLQSRLTKHFPNPDHIRYELHRVWVVEANLVDGKRHAYHKRRWFIDEDSWNIVASENFDSRGNLWRVGLFLSDYHYDVEAYMKHTQAFMDLPSGAYVVSFVTLEGDEWDYTIPYMGKSEFTPAAIRKMTRR